MERGRTSNFTVGKSDKYSLSQVINVYRDSHAGSV